MDSVQRIEGGLVTYRSYHGSDAPAGAASRPEGMNCATRRWYGMDQGRLVPVPEDEPDIDPYVSGNHPLFLKLCR